MMKYFGRISCILSVLFSLSAVSCIDEDSNCPPLSGEVRVYFSYPLPNERGDGTIISAEQIDLFIFNEQGKFVKSLIDYSPVLTSDYCIITDLEEGKYIFVSWINLKDCYVLSHQEISEEVLIDELLLHLQTDENDTVTTQIHNLYFGNLREEEIINEKNRSLVIPLVRNTYNLTVKTRGLDPSPDHDYHIVVSDKNGSYSFDNSYASLREVHYKSTCAIMENNQLSASLNALRLNEDENYATLRLQNATTGKTVYQRNLVEMVTAYREQGMDIDFDTMFDFEITLGFVTDTDVTVSINGWDLVEDKEELR